MAGVLIKRRKSYTETDVHRNRTQLKRGHLSFCLLIKSNSRDIPIPALLSNECYEHRTGGKFCCVTEKNRKELETGSYKRPAEQP